MGQMRGLLGGAARFVKHLVDIRMLRHSRAMLVKCLKLWSLKLGIALNYQVLNVSKYTAFGSSPFSILYVFRYPEQLSLLSQYSNAGLF